MKERIKWVDWAKTICMFLVILGHCHLSVQYLFINRIIYSFHIPLFFFLSGLLCTSKFNHDTFKKDVKLILIPYITFGMLGIVLTNFLSHTLAPQTLLLNIYSLLIGLDSSIGAIWFLPALFICKQLFHIQHLSNNNPYIRLSILAISFLSIYFFNNSRLNLPFFSDSGICALPFFCIGNYSSKLCKTILGKSVQTRTTVFALLLPLIIFTSQRNGPVVMAECAYGSSILLYYMNAFMGILCILLISSIIETSIPNIVYIMAYGTIVTLGLHGFLLQILHYYIPVALGCYNSTYSIYIALIYCLIVYFICYFVIIKADCLKIASLFGLRGHIRCQRNP